MKKSLVKPNIKSLGIPFLYLIFSIMFLIVFFKIGLSQINNQRKILADEQSSNKILQQKEFLLRNFQTGIEEFVDASANAIPEKNPVLVMVSQLKNLSAIQGVTLTSFKVGTESQHEGISAVELSVGVEGTPSTLFNFLQTLSQVSPISLIDKVKINTVAGAATGNISIKVFFAPFPQRLPALTEPIVEFSDQENKLLEELSSLSPPLFSNLNPQSPAAREDPFQ